MKIRKIFLTAALILISPLLFAQESEDKSTEETGITKTTELPPAFVAWKNTKLTFTEGISYAQITRIETIPNAPNYIRETMLGGAFFSVRTNDLSLFDFIFTLSAYYPFYNAFNGMPQKTHNMFNYALDSFLGVVYTYDRLSWVKIDTALGMHYMFQLTDEYYMHYMGLGLMLGIQFPLTRRLTLIEQNYFSLDNANLGSNKNVQPFDGSYQYHISLGLRYSKKVPNEYHYIGK